MSGNKKSVEPKVPEQPHQIKRGSDLMKFFEIHWRSESGGQIVQVFKIQEYVWNRLFVMMHNRNTKLQVKYTDTVIEIEHSMGVAVFINKEYRG